MITEALPTRDKILSTAFQLFLTNGYENTPVQAIIDAVGIAKGTFYHHFVGKEEMLVSLVEGMSRRVVEAVRPVVDDPQLGAVAKLLAASRASVAQKTQDVGPETALLVRQMRSPANKLLTSRIDDILTDWVKPLYLRIIRQGVDEGVFRVKDAGWATDLVLGSIMAMKNPILDGVIAHLEGDPTALARVTGIYQSIEQAVERILGAEEGSLPIYTSIDLKDVFDRSRSTSPGGNS